MDGLIPQGCWLCLKQTVPPSFSVTDAGEKPCKEERAWGFGSLGLRPARAIVLVCSEGGGGRAQAEGGWRS